MRRLSKKTGDLIQKLHVEQSFWGKLIGQYDFPISVFDDIASEGEVLAIPHLTEFLLNNQVDVRNAVARTIGRLLANVKPTDFPQLDESCRNFWPYQSAPARWPHLKPAEVKTFWRLPNALPVIGCASFHGSGFIREAAINELANNRDGAELPFLLIRLNDWVGVVRESAATVIVNRICPDYAGHFLRNLHLVLRLRSCGRSQHEIIVKRITALLQDPSAAPILREGILSNDRWLRRESFQLAIAMKSEQGMALIKEMLSDADPIMRLWAARNVAARLEDGELLPILLELIQDRFVAIRCEALTAFAKRFPAESQDKLNMALLNGSASVRATARFWIKAQKPETNFAVIYRNTLTEPLAKRQRAAILGLAETGTASDAGAVLALLDAPALSVRKAAIHALATLDGDHYLEHFVTALTNSHAGISNEAARALAKRTNTIIDRVYSLFKSPAPAHVRTNLFRLMQNLPFWARGIFLFEALRDRDEHVVELGLRALQNWLSESRNMATPPTKSDVQQLSNALKASGGMLSKDDVQELEFFLRTYK